ncbi:MAG: flagellar basal body-associated FliL family protein [Candidatus Zixiibacteriota bacterium]
MPPRNEPAEPDAKAAPETAAKAKKKIPPVAIYAVIGLVMVGLGYFVGTKFFGSAKNVEDKAVAEQSKETKKSSKSQGAEGATSVFLMEGVIVNPAGTGGTRFLSVSLGFEVGSPATQKLLEERKPLIKDALITILGSKTIEQLTDPKQKEITRFQIKKRVEQLLGIEDLAAVYFTDFVLQ